MGDHLAGIPETIAYTLLFCLGVFHWNRKPRKAWNAIAVVALSPISIFSGLGLATSLGLLPGSPVMAMPAGFSPY
jgi:hypothetical protein